MDIEKIQKDGRGGEEVILLNCLGMFDSLSKGVFRRDGGWAGRKEEGAGRNQGENS